MPAKTFTDRCGRPFTIRVAQPGDAAAMLDYIRRVAAETEFFIMEPGEFPETEEQEREWIQNHLDQPGWLLLLAEDSEGIIGNLSFENGRYRRIAHRGVFGVSVAEQSRGRGVGTALLQSLLDWAEANPLIEKVGMEVFATNENAISLYKKLGFVEEGRLPRDVKLGLNEYLDTIAMHRFVKR